MDAAISHKTLNQDVFLFVGAIVAEGAAAFQASEELAGVVPSQRPELAQFQCNGAFAAAKLLKRNPREIATLWMQHIEARHPGLFKAITVEGPGFLNLSLSDPALIDLLRAHAQSARFCCRTAARSERVVVDFGGPNVAKPMHVGHLRSAIIGDSLQKLFRFYGHQVTSDVHLGDWGTQMGLLIEEIRLRQPNLPYFDSDRVADYPVESPVSLTELSELYPVAAQRAKDEPAFLTAARQATADLQSGKPGYRALWQHFVNLSVHAVKSDFEALGVRFDLWLGESDAQPLIPTLLSRLEQAGLTQEHEGMLIVPLEKAPPLILRKSDGAAIYATTDLATIFMRQSDLKTERILYVVDTRQALHFKQVFQVSEQANLLPVSALEHVNFGTVNGPDGKPFRTRAGGVPALRELLTTAVETATARLADADLAATFDESERKSIASAVGIGAVKFSDLQHDRTTDYNFDLERFIHFEGYTAPSIQYQAVRIKTLLDKALPLKPDPAMLQITAEQERDLVLTLLHTPLAVDEAYKRRAPNYICAHAYQVAKAYSRFYKECPVLSAPNPDVVVSRLTLSAITLQAVELLFSLLGVPIPQRM